MLRRSGIRIVDDYNVQQASDIYFSRDLKEANIVIKNSQVKCN